jgi:hypothetical protein
MSDPTAQQKAVAEAGMAHQRAMDMVRQTDAIFTALKSYPDEDRKRMLDEALGKLGSKLKVS